MRRVLLPVLAVTGVVIGHTITYAVAFPDDHHRASCCGHGHAYWQAAVAVALLAGALAAGSHVAHAVRRTSRCTLPRAGVRLAALQMVIFTMMEASERVAVDQPLTSLFDHRVLLLGLVVQVARRRRARAGAAPARSGRGRGGRRRRRPLVAGSTAPSLSLSWTAPIARPRCRRRPPVRQPCSSVGRVVDIHDHARQRKEQHATHSHAADRRDRGVCRHHRPQRRSGRRPTSTVTSLGDKYELTVGWGDEPTFTGYKNSVTLRILDHSAGNKPVADVTDIKAQVKTGDETVDLTLDQAFGEPGLYEATLIPTRAGTYSFNFTGAINGQAFDETFTSGEDTFDAPKDASEVAVPGQGPEPGRAGRAPRP